MKRREIENDAETLLVKRIREAGGRCPKFVSPGNSGVPDRLVILPGRPTIYVELKKPGEEPRKLQRVWIKRLRDLGQSVFVLHGTEEVELFIHEVVGR